jgi:hypothetical protein
MRFMHYDTIRYERFNCTSFRHKLGPVDLALALTIDHKRICIQESYNDPDAPESAGIEVAKGEKHRRGGRGDVWGR